MESTLNTARPSDHLYPSTRIQSIRVAGASSHHQKWQKQSGSPSDQEAQRPSQRPGISSQDRAPIPFNEHIRKYVFYSILVVDRHKNRDISKKHYGSQHTPLKCSISIPHRPSLPLTPDSTMCWWRCEIQIYFSTPCTSPRRCKLQAAGRESSTGKNDDGREHYSLGNAIRCC